MNTSGCVNRIKPDTNVGLEKSWIAITSLQKRDFLETFNHSDGSLQLEAIGGGLISIKTKATKTLGCNMEGGASFIHTWDSNKEGFLRDAVPCIV